MTPYASGAGWELYHGDCREILPTLPGPFAIVADPPYGVGYAPRSHCKIREPVAGDCEPFDPSHLLTTGKQLILWGANAYIDRLPVSRGWLVWDKTFPKCARHSQAELAWANCVRTVRLHREAYHGFMRKRDGWFHPTQKPVELMKWCLGFLDPALLVVDPYVGSGPILLAAQALGRPVIGIEIEERYCEIAARRLSATLAS